MPKKHPFSKVESALRTVALAYPEATEDFPWGERTIKVKGKIFLFQSFHDGVYRVTAKLPLSSTQALALPFCEPTGYGLGKHGWVTASFNPGDEIPDTMFAEWIDESYRAVAPKKLVARLEPDAPNVPNPKPRRKAV